jgi:cytoskeletal protein RodZ
MEQGAWDSFPAPVYIRGFARTYAKYLRLDEKEVVEEVVAEMGNRAEWDGGGSGPGRSRGPIDWVMLQLSRVRWTVVFPLLLGFVVLLVGWLAFQSWQESSRQDPLDRLGPGLGEPKSRPPSTLPLPTNSPSPRASSR